MLRRFFLALTLSLLLALASGEYVAAQSDRMAPGEPHESNLAVGNFPPSSFELPSAVDGALFDLEAQRGERPILLLFFRGTW